MDDTAITSLVTGAVTITITIVGFFTLWIKLRYGVQQAEEAASKAKVVEKKIDDNTALTNTAKTAATIAATKADNAADVVTQTNEEKLELLHKIEKQTDGTLTEMKNLVQTLAERVAKLEDYNHDSTHRLASSVQAMHLQVAALVALQTGKVVVSDKPPTSRPE